MDWDYEQAVDWLYDRSPSYQYKGLSSLKKYDLSNIQKLCSALGHPQESLKVIHIAGTNGKGSVAHMVASILQQANYRVGLYTSPHLLDFRERIRINGTKVPRSFVLGFISRYRGLILQHSFSFFEVSVAMAFLYFSQQKVDFSVIEVGLGGRLDSTNIVHPMLAAITSISLDHEQILGNTIADIAKEKAGIIKPYVPLILGEVSLDAMEIIMEMCEQNHAPLIDATKSPLEYQTDLEGAYQKKNLKVAVALIEELKKLGYPIEENHISNGLKKVFDTGLRGRWQTLQKEPLVIYDVAHNAAAFAQILSQFEVLPHSKKCLVLGFSKDKTTHAIFQILSDMRLEGVLTFLTQSKSSRAKPLDVMASQLGGFDLSYRLFDSIDKAYREALRCVGKEGVVLIAGSFFLAEGIFT